MSGEAIKAVSKHVTRETLSRVGQTMDEKRRPSDRVLQVVIDHLGKKFVDKRGYVNETQQQIVESINGVYSLETVGNALTAWEKSGYVIAVKKGARGEGTRRVFSFYDPKNLAKRNGVDPVANENDHDGVSAEIQRGRNEIQRGNRPTQRGNPATPKEQPKENLKPPADPQGVDEVVRIALRLDQERGGEIRTRSLMSSRTRHYQVAATAILRDDPTANHLEVATKLVNERTNPQQAAAKPTPLQPWDKANPDCPICNGDGMVWHIDVVTDERTNRLCKCSGGTYDGTKDSELPLDQRVENDEKLTQQVRDLAKTFRPRRT